MTIPKKLFSWPGVIVLSLAAYIAWACVLRWGSPQAKALATAAVVISPIPPIP